MYDTIVEWILKEDNHTFKIVLLHNEDTLVRHFLGDVQGRQDCPAFGWQSFQQAANQFAGLDRFFAFATERKSF